MWHRVTTYVFSVVVIGLCMTAGQADAADSESSDLIIAKYGSVMVKSSELEAKVSIDGIASGSVNSVIESVIVGEHVILCRSADKTISGTFTIKRNETLMLEAQFDQEKLIDTTEIEKAEAAKKKKLEAAKQEALKLEEQRKAAESKKAAPKKAEPKKAEAKNPKEAFRELHLNVIKVSIESGTAEINVSGKVNPQVVSKYAEQKRQSGKYYQTKQGLLLCETAPCLKEWSSSFVYTDENGKSDAFLLVWRETIFNGMTPTGTSKRELELCLNGTCQKAEDNTAADTSRDFIVDRYTIGWTKSLAVIRRSDVMKELVDSGGNVGAY